MKDNDFEYGGACSRRNQAKDGTPAKPCTAQVTQRQINAVGSSLRFGKDFLLLCGQAGRESSASLLGGLVQST